MRVRLAAIAILGLAFGALAALAVVPGARQHAIAALLPATLRPEAATGKALVGGPFALVSTKGATVRDTDFSGRYMLVFFGYTSCPDVCPATLQVVAAALDRLGPRADQLAALFITLDPDRDTPAKMADYTQSFGPRLIGLTGTPDAIGSIAKAYRVYAKKIPSESGDAAGYTLDHTSILYLMGPDGSYLAHFTPATTADQLVTRLNEVLSAH